MKVVLLTGASSGIRYQTAQLLAQRGCKVYGAARQVKRMKPLQKWGVIPVELDMTDEKSMESCVKMIIENEGKIDVLINNAGYGSYGAVEDVSLEEGRKQFEVNLFGVARLTQLVLPVMRKQQAGKIISISSVGGKITTLFGAWYHATKFALEGFSDCLRMEVAEFGIDVVLIEPGAIKTEWGSIAADHLLASGKGGAYEEMAVKTEESMRKQYTSNLLSKPERIAKVIAKAGDRKRPKTRYLIGFDAKPILLMKRLLPDRVYDKLVKNML
ncbi:oxidoreductase [Alkalihalobacillus oceani]|uniref:Oxidoreductase n=1 Tax=Halalkalibacter oceani TaxID=1653776 RepID=A0A9X2DUI8_9BACI|nr:oxidoreductase [Halalkalibacter oceani]MCM3716325.1 oxidoreductase [Halalkalibacter oceani]